MSLLSETAHADAKVTVRKGSVPRGVRTADLGEFGDWADAERIVMNLHRARADAVEWNGGPMPTTL